jgi:MFS family permease
MISVRHGDPKKVGYIASGFWTGFTLGRVVLADITHKFGERRMVFFYLALAVVMQLMFWFVPSIPVNAVAVFLLGMDFEPLIVNDNNLTIRLGFFIGPFYPVGLYILTEVVPQELHVGAIGMLIEFRVFSHCLLDLAIANTLDKALLPVWDKPVLLLSPS